MNTRVRNESLCNLDKIFSLSVQVSLLVKSLAYRDVVRFNF